MSFWSCAVSWNAVSCNTWCKIEKRGEIFLALSMPWWYLCWKTCSYWSTRSYGKSLSRTMQLICENQDNFCLSPIVARWKPMLKPWLFRSSAWLPNPMWQSIWVLKRPASLCYWFTLTIRYGFVDSTYNNLFNKMILLSWSIIWVHRTEYCPKVTTVVVSSFY